MTFMYLVGKFRRESVALNNNYQKIIVPSVGSCDRAFEIDAYAHSRLSDFTQQTLRRLIKLQFKQCFGHMYDRLPFKQVRLQSAKSSNVKIPYRFM